MNIQHEYHTARQREMMRQRPRFKPPTAREQQLADAYGDGARAYDEGKSLEDNEYSQDERPTLWAKWRDGFVDAKQSEENSNE